ncbi:MAG TPA: ComEC/Rec2 family competence protein [Treponema sp.]|nr:ComEC/Rec2 family competence protein [Treponema sp.]
MVEPLQMKGLSPAVSTASGAALLFYSFSGGLLPLALAPKVFFASLFIICVFIGLFRALDILSEQKLKRIFRYFVRLLIAFALGITIGLVALHYKNQSRFAAPMPVESIKRIEIRLINDARLLPKGSLSGQGLVQYCEDSRGLRISSRGIINLLISDSALALRELAGQGSTLLVEGSFLPSKDGNGDATSIPTFAASRVVKLWDPSGIEKLRFNLRKSLVQQLRGPEWGGFAAALLLGFRDDLDQEVTALYRKTGSSHVLALSGMHLGIIAALLAFVLRKPLGVRLSSFVSLGVLFVYVYLAGFQPSLSRSLVMYTLMLLCFFQGIPVSLLPIIGLSFIIQLLIDPVGMASLSAMLSYAALTGIVLLSPPILDVVKGRLPLALAASFATSLGAFTATAPLVAGFFGVLYPIGILVGALLGALASLFMIGSILYLTSSYILPPLMPFVGMGLEILYKIHVLLLRYIASLSVEWGNVNWVITGLGSLAMASLFVYGQYRGKTKRTLTAFN